jgi:tetratricopeptide (TPR) repeat protein
MRWFVGPFAVLYLAAAPLWGQTPKFAQLGTMTRAEDSPGTSASNQIFYNSPRTPEPQASEPARKVSVEQLQHPLSRKGASLIRQAQNFADMGDHDKAIATLRLALRERSAIPYAHGLLGSEYLKINQIPAAIAALEFAVKLLPRNAVNHSNLGCALVLAGSAERGEQEVRRALELDRNNEKTRYILSLITHARENVR